MTSKTLAENILIECNRCNSFPTNTAKIITHLLEDVLSSSFQIGINRPLLNAFHHTGDCS